MALDRLDRVADDPLAQALARSSAEDRPLGVALSSYVPLEVLDAFHLCAVRLPGRPRDGYPRADGVLQAYACTYVRAGLESVLAGDLPLGLVATASGCDAVTAIPGILGAAAPAVPVAHLRLPIAMESEAAERHATLALLDFCRDVEALLGRPLDPGVLESATADREAVRIRLGGLFGRLPTRDLPASRVYAAAIAAQVLAPRDFLALADEALPVDAVPARAPGIPLLLSGEVLPSVAFVRDLESLGAAVVADDTNTGTREAGRRVRRDEPNRLKAVAESLVRRPLHSPERFVTGRPKAVAARARDAGARAAILLHNKFCDPCAFEAPSLLAALKAAGIPALVLEVDRQAGLTGGDRTRVQTLLEALP